MERLNGAQSWKKTEDVINECNCNTEEKGQNHSVTEN